MNTEHHNGKPQVQELPRSIEEKPIVYDEGHLEEVREIAALPSICHPTRSSLPSVCLPEGSPVAMWLPAS